MKVFFRALLILCACTRLWAQDDQLDEFTIEDVPDEKATPYFGIGGGFIASFNFLKMDEVNNLVNQVLPGQELKAPLVMFGAQGFVAVPFIEGSRVGFTSLGGSLAVDGTATVNATEYKRKFELEASYNAISFDYGFIPFDGLALLPGVMGGWGTMTISASQTPVSGDRTINGEFDFGSPTSNNFREISSSYGAITPNLNIEYAISRFGMIRLNAGYTIAFPGTWEVDNGIAPVKNVSEDISMSGLSAQVGIFIGLFNH